MANAQIMNQITKALPRATWDTVTIKETGEPLVELIETKKLKLGGIHKVYEPLFLLRQTVAEKLYKVSENLPQGMVLIIIEGYRTMQHQQDSWDRNFQRVKNDNQGMSDAEVEKIVRMVIAKPHPLANHHCGGAVDVTLGYENGELLDMGSPYPSEAYGTDIREKFPMFPNSLLKKLITKEQEKNRKLLREAMEQEDFVWYPAEWWHYCWGDRMWAVYSRRTSCMYGSIEP